MTPEQLGEQLQELVITLNGVVQAIPEGADCTVSEAAEFLALAKDNRLQLLAIHKALSGTRTVASSRRTA
jgi:hypothetical protein